MTSGSSFKSNGRVEGEMNVVKKAVRTLISAGVATLKQWPLVSRHVGERRLRLQLHQLGWPAGRLLRFGAKAFALRKSWQARYAPWREVREEVKILGPDLNSSITNTSYFVESTTTGRRFFTDDVVIPEAHPPAVEDQVLYLPERPEGMPQRRHRRKAPVQALSMLHIEGERAILERFASQFEPIPGDEAGASSDSWSLETEEATLSSSSSSNGGGPDELFWTGGGDVEGVPNTWCGGSSPGTPNEDLSRAPVLRRLHCNVTEYIKEELQLVDATSLDQTLWMPTLTQAMIQRVALEDQLLDMADIAPAEEKITEEFLVTKTISSREVLENMESWEPSIRAEYQQLVTQKQAVRQMKRSDLQRISEERGLPIELLPGKMVHTRKAVSGAYRSRAVVCGNYEQASDDEKYAGGADGMQIRAMTRTAALKRWSIAGTDIRVAFLNAPKRNANKLTAMEVPTVFKRLGLAAQDDIWLIEKALYGLVSSPRDWCVHRDEVMPTISWRRTRQGAVVVGHFIKTPDENIWRMEEVEVENGVRHWSGLLSVYVDDLLIAAEEGASSAAMQAIAKVWAISDVEMAGINQSIKYCGFEIEVPHDGDGFIVSQKKYQQELMTRWNISEKVAYPAYKISEDEELSQQHIEQKDIKEAQALTGALLWLSTRTRPDLCQGVAAMSRLVTRNPLKAVQIGHILLKYVNGNPGGMHFPSEVNPWGKRDQLKIKRHEKSLEIYADIAYAASAGHRSIQGLVVMFAGVPIGWQTCQQPFVTHSTAEAELVSYCEGLLAGRATEALLCAMWGEELTNNSFERVMYGDNVAAIGLAHGTTTSSWRTRHLRIRSSLLKEALDEKQAIYGGPWKLIHLKGTELVADGCTKPLNGQAFFRFLEDLGLQRGDCDGAAEEPQVSGPAPISEVSGGGGFAAAKALILGSALLSSAKGASDDDDETDYTPFLVTGAVLMALGTIYAGQVIHSASSYCLRRLWAG